MTMKPTSIRLQDEVLVELDARAESEGSSRGDLIARAIDELLHPKAARARPGD